MKVLIGCLTLMWIIVIPIVIFVMTIRYDPWNSLLFVVWLASSFLLFVEVEKADG